MKGKRMVSRFGNCYGLKDMEELTPKEEEQYETLGTIKEVVDKCFKETGVDSETGRVCTRGGKDRTHRVMVSTL